MILVENDNQNESALFKKHSTNQCFSKLPKYARNTKICSFTIDNLNVIKRKRSQLNVLPPPTPHTHRLSLLHYNRKHFHENNIDEITILHYNFDHFSVFFFKITKCHQNLILQKSIKNYTEYPSICLYFLEFTIYKTYIGKFCTYFCDFKQHVILKFHRKCLIFWLFLKKIHNVNSIENVCFLAIFEENQ